MPKQTSVETRDRNGGHPAGDRHTGREARSRASQQSPFFAMMSRMKYIERWMLMRSSSSENISEHSLQVGMLAHALAVLHNVRFGGSLDVSKAALIGMYHDASEIITGDMPTPVKYYNREILEAFHGIEDRANRRLLAMLPEDMRPYYEELFFPCSQDAYLWKLVKAADKLSAYIKCIEEAGAGNGEFLNAQQSIRALLAEMELPEVDVFLEEFLPSFGKTLDELNRPAGEDK